MIGLFFCIGYGEDVYCFVLGFFLVLGGVVIFYVEFGVVVYFDGDVVFYVVVDVLFLGFVLGDIGQYFFDIVVEWKGMDLCWILVKVLEFVEECGYWFVNVVFVVILDWFKLGLLCVDIVVLVVELFGLFVGEVGVSFKIFEGLVLEYVQICVIVLLGCVDD